MPRRVVLDLSDDLVARVEQLQARRADRGEVFAPVELLHEALGRGIEALEGEDALPAGEQLRRWRKGQGLSVVAAARLVGVDPSAWSHWEAGRNAPTWGMRVGLEGVTGVARGRW